jgi:hypothetical protein
MSSSLPATPPQSPGTVLTLQQRRVQQILWAVMAAFGIAALMSFSKGGYTSVALELVALALLGLAYRWNQRGELARASQWMLATLIAGIFGLMAAGEGLYDEGTLAFPAILIFAGMFGSRRMLWVLMAWLQGALVLLFVLHQIGLLPHSPAACGLAAADSDEWPSWERSVFLCGFSPTTCISTMAQAGVREAGA